MNEAPHPWCGRGNQAKPHHKCFLACVHKLTEPWYLTLRNRHCMSDFWKENYNITTPAPSGCSFFKARSAPLFFFCAPRVVLVFRWGLQSTRSQSMVLLSRWRAHKFTLRTQTQPNSIHPTQARELQSNGLLSFKYESLWYVYGRGNCDLGSSSSTYSDSASTFRFVFSVFFEVIVSL